jgi:RNA polymerase sigma factor (sigma-70 family)
MIEPSGPWERIVAQIMEGENAGLEALYAFFGRSVRFLLAQQLHFEDVEGKLHDTFLAVVKAIRAGQVRDASRLPFFLKTVAQRQVAGHLSNPATRRYVQLTAALQESRADQRPSPEKDALSQERQKIALRILHNLPEIDRRILIRFYLEGQPADEICADLRISQTQFRLRKSRAKERLRRLIRSAVEERKPVEILLRKHAGAGH